ncbi:MAG: helix-turn-helix transcriptional regulator [Pseudomonadota bacterium]
MSAINSGSDSATSVVKLEDFIALTARVADLDELKAYFMRFLDTYGVVAVAAYAFPLATVGAKEGTSPIICTFPDDAIEFYWKNRCADQDPLMQASLSDWGPVQYSRASSGFDYTPLQRRFFEKLRKEGYADALALPVTSRPAAAAYFVLPLRDARPLDEGEKLVIQHGCQHFYYQYRAISNRFKCPTMTPRERQIMVGILLGKSNVAIAAHLGISDHTVDTHVRRLFAKLEVSSRVEAVIKVMGRDLLTAQLNAA